jgi:single-strand DNA-binding protein
MNKVILMGRLTKDPELRYTTTNNVARCTFTLAVDRRFVKQGEERQADFINIVAWRNQAEFCSKYFTKGLKVVVVGSLQTRNWDDADGKRHYITEVVADELYFAESRRNEGGSPYRPARDAEGPSFSGNDQNEGYFQTEDDDELPF